MYRFKKDGALYVLLYYYIYIYIQRSIVSIVYINSQI